MLAQLRHGGKVFEQVFEKKGTARVFCILGASILTAVDGLYDIEH